MINMFYLDLNLRHIKISTAHIRKVRPSEMFKQNLCTFRRANHKRSAQNIWTGYVEILSESLNRASNGMVLDQCIVHVTGTSLKPVSIVMVPAEAVGTVFFQVARRVKAVIRPALTPTV